MSQAFHAIVQMERPFNMIVLVVLIGCTAGVLTSLFTQLRKFASHRLELQFKRELLDRGMSGDDIRQILQTRATAAEK